MMARRLLYQPLLDLLAASADDSLVLSLAEIEALIGRPLALSAQVAPSYWTGPSGARLPALLFQAGWEAHLAIRARRVTFRRAPLPDPSC
jgi:hypothetical protein